MTLWGDFTEHLRHNNGELSAYWMTYIDIVENVLLALLRSSREGNWSLHLHAIKTMIFTNPQQAVAAVPLRFLGVPVHQVSQGE